MLVIDCDNNLKDGLHKQCESDPKASVSWISTQNEEHINETCCKGQEFLHLRDNKKVCRINRCTPERCRARDTQSVDCVHFAP